MPILGGRYRLIARIDAGGNAHVWSGHDEVLDRPVAVKLLTDAGDEESSEVSRALNEARCAGRLAHPNVAAVYDFGAASRRGQETSYLVMELLEGELLQHYLGEGALHPATAVQAMAEVAAGLAAAHQHAIVHRDIKPANIALTQTGAKILDFGIAARSGSTDHRADGSVEGTAAYLAPERADGAAVSPAIDIYSLGVVFYLSLTGHLPWDAHDLPEMVRAHRTLPPAPLPELPGLPKEAARICLACLDKDPTARPTAIAAALVLATSINSQVYLPPIVRPRRPAGEPAFSRLDEPTERCDVQADPDAEPWQPSMSVLPEDPRA